MSPFTVTGPLTNTRLLPSNTQEWVPLPYMERAVAFLAGHYAAGLPLLPGGRKTSITLAAFEMLRRTGKARTMLVVAPLRVCRQTWRQEAAKWAQFKHLTFALLHGPKKAAALKSGADIYLINPEGVDWLCKQYMGLPLPFDVVAIDELTKFQNSQAQRSKALRPRLKNVRYRWALTGSLFAKGPMSVFGQQLMLDDGAALGRYFTHFRDQYFHVGFNGFDYEPLPGSEKRIADAIAPYWFYMDPKDYAELPPLIDVPHIADMEPHQKKLYKQMVDDMLLRLPQGMVTAANSGACYSKMAQMANGAVYLDGPEDGGRGPRNWTKLHDTKLDMLEELIDELNGEPLLVAYEFNHDLERLRERFGDDLPYLGNGTTAKQESAWIEAWNRRELPLLVAHPQSAGHGLNMQEGQAYNVAWFSVTWDWELYDQFIRRVRRSGNTQARIFNHILTIRGTIDEDKLAAIREKDFTERRLMSALNAQILREESRPDNQPETGELRMVAKKLSSPPAQTQTQAQGAAPPPANGWGQPPQPSAAPAPANQPAPAPANGWGQPPNPETEAQRTRIQEAIAPQPDRSQAAMAAFGGAVGEQAAAIEGGDYGAVTNAGPANGNAAASTGWASPTATPAPTEQVKAWGGKPVAGDPAEPPTDKPKRTRRKAADSNDGGDGGGIDAEQATELALIDARARVIAAVMASSPDMDLADIIEIARDTMDFVTRG